MFANSDLNLLPKEQVTQVKTEDLYLESQFRKVLDRYRVVLSNVPDMICIHRPDGRIAWASGSAKSILHYNPDDLLGRRMDEFCHPDDKAILSTGYESLSDANRVKLRYRAQQGDGAWIWVETIHTPIFNGKPEPIAMQSHTRDVTDQVERENRLVGSRSFIASLLDNALVPVAIFSIDGKFTAVNEAWCSLLGYEKNELLSMSLMDVTPRKYHNKDSESLRRLAAGEIDMVEVARKFVRKTGDEVPVYIWGGVIREGDQSIVGLFTQAQAMWRILDLVEESDI